VWHEKNRATPTIDIEVENPDEIFMKIMDAQILMELQKGEKAESHTRRQTEEGSFRNGPFEDDK
jgi:hypothetical protein